VRLVEIFFLNLENFFLVQSIGIDKTNTFQLKIVGPQIWAVCVR